MKKKAVKLYQKLWKKEFNAILKKGRNKMTNTEKERLRELSLLLNKN